MAKFARYVEMRSDLLSMETCSLLVTSVVFRCVVLAMSMKEEKAAKTVHSAKPDIRGLKVKQNRTKRFDPLLLSLPYYVKPMILYSSTHVRY